VIVFQPYDMAVPAPSFALSSPDFASGEALPASAYADRGNRSPALTWGPLPSGTRSLVVTAYDADAPIPGGLWHWLAADIPSDLTGLAGGAGAFDETLPGEGRHLVNDLGGSSYAGVAPPPGTGTHRLFVCVTALGVARLELPRDASPALLNISMIEHTLGRAVLIGTAVA
jgi:Raf kinase inhibitor-like YbhB/YbcL family protein